jgi:hypothetical protein
MFEHHPHLGTTAFERTADGFVYYANAWSKGIPVSAAARHAYIYGPRSTWFEAILGQSPSVPRRPYWRSVKRILTAFFWGYDPAEPVGESPRGGKPPPNYRKTGL